MKTHGFAWLPLLLGLVLFRTALGAEPTVVVHASEDQVFSEPILRDFERDTGIRVKAVYDTEETKGTGLMNRLLAEKNNPQADVYWANEPIRAEILKQRGVSAPYRSPNGEGIPAAFKDAEGYWTGFSARARVFIVQHKAHVKPESLDAYTDPRLAGQGVIANPLFGTTATHVAALFTLWGDERTKGSWTRSKRTAPRFPPATAKARIWWRRGNSSSAWWTAMTQSTACAKANPWR